jgi:hypothetical protein
MNQTTLQENIFGTSLNLLNISEEHPYCGMAHYFALKDGVRNSNNDNALAAKSSLFFNNSYYLQLLLQEEENNRTKTTSDIIVENTISRELVIIFEEPKKEDTKIDIKTIENVEDTNVVINETNKTEILETKEIEFESPLSNISKQSNTAETELSFEPLHTSDYFASQGIKLSNLVLPNDKLGMQLKSFTSWLKTMKKTHPEKLPTNNILAEVAIQKLAENSNVEADIYTEPMAEAYVQQGKHIKAIEIYSKLSLMFPEKSAFFADKIENLK